MKNSKTRGWGQKPFGLFQQQQNINFGMSSHSGLLLFPSHRVTVVEGITSCLTLNCLCLCLYVSCPFLLILFRFFFPAIESMFFFPAAIELVQLREWPLVDRPSREPDHSTVGDEELVHHTIKRILVFWALIVVRCIVCRPVKSPDQSPVGDEVVLGCSTITPCPAISVTLTKLKH